MKPYILGFLVAGLIWSSVMMTVSLIAWQAKGCVEWGVIVMTLGVAVKVMVDKLGD
jgi:hypothetical protein